MEGFDSWKVEAQTSSRSVQTPAKTCSREGPDSTTKVMTAHVQLAKKHRATRIRKEKQMYIVYMQ